MWMKNKITILCQQVRWKHFFLYLAFLDFFFSLFEIFALLFFSSQILSLSLAFTVFDIKNMKCEFHGPRGEESPFTNFVVLFFGREISVLGDWVPSLMKLGTLLCIGKKQKKMFSKSSVGVRGLRAVFTELLAVQKALNYPWFSILSCQSSLLPLWIAVRKKRFVPVRADCCPGTGPNECVFVGEWILKHVFSFL